jgi:hypothetical protein
MKALFNDPKFAKAALVLVTLVLFVLSAGAPDSLGLP